MTSLCLITPALANKRCKWPQACLHLQTYCRHRYLPYLESHSYSSKYKQLLACGSVMIAPRIDYPDFFLRALEPGVHYVELNSSNLCEDTVSAFSLAMWLEPSKSYHRRWSVHTQSHGG